MIKRGYGVEDDCGNMGSCTQTIVIDDTEDPVLTCGTIDEVQCKEDLPAAYSTMIAFLAGTRADQSDK